MSGRGDDRVILSAGPKARSEESRLGSAPALDQSARTIEIRAALKEAMARLRAAQVPSHTLAAELLLMHALGCDRAWLYTHPEAALDPDATEKYFALVARRAAGEPTQYLTGKQEFWGLEFEVTPAVLIPRPETEHVVEVALERLVARGIRSVSTPEPPALRCASPTWAPGRAASPLRSRANCHTPKSSPRIFPRPPSRSPAATPPATAWPVAYLFSTPIC
jgi:hypothetical protein